MRNLDILPHLYRTFDSTGSTAVAAAVATRKNISNCKETFNVNIMRMYLAYTYLCHCFRFFNSTDRCSVCIIDDEDFTCKNKIVCHDCRVAVYEYYGVAKNTVSVQCEPRVTPTHYRNLSSTFLFHIHVGI